MATESKRDLVLGTAGHIDHGKSTLVQALTGTDPDRLSEEKQRGITIELGFAQLELPDGSAMGVVDVPGHERFVRQMIAGSTGIDVALLCIAADDGIMPQTEEHLAVLQLLAVPTCVVALTKCDLVDEEWALFMEDEVVKARVERLKEDHAFIVRHYKRAALSYRLAYGRCLPLKYFLPHYQYSPISHDMAII